MKIITQLSETLSSHSKNEFKKSCLIFLVVFTISSGSILFYRNNKLKSLNKELRKLNLRRTQVQEILSKNFKVNHQQELVNALLEKDKNFLILHYFESVIQDLNLRSNLTQKPIPIIHEPEALKNKGYSEVSLEIKLNNLNMLQVTQLLEAIETNKRIYTKSLDIESTGSKVNILLIIATLKIGTGT